MKIEHKLFWWGQDKDASGIVSEGKTYDKILFARIREYVGAFPGYHVHTATGDAGTFIEGSTVWATKEEAQARAQELFLMTLPKKKFQWGFWITVLAMLSSITWFGYRQFALQQLGETWRPRCEEACVTAGFDTGFVDLPLNPFSKPVALGCTCTLNKAGRIPLP